MSSNISLRNLSEFFLSQGQYWTLGVTYWTPIGIILEGLPIYRFRVIIGIRIIRDFYWNNSMTPVQYWPREWSKKNFSANLKSTTQNYPQDDILEQFIYLHLPEYDTSYLESNTGPGSDQKKIFSQRNQYCFKDMDLFGYAAWCQTYAGVNLSTHQNVESRFVHLI